MSVLTSLVVALCAQGEASTDPRLESHRRMLATLSEMATQAYRTNPIFGLDKVEALRARRAATDDGTPREELMVLFPALGLEELFLGNDAEAVALLERTRALVLELPPEKRPEGLTRLTYNLAVACMRLGESQNCVARHTSESCILPIQGSGVHVDQEGSRRAIGYLLEVLAAEDAGPDTRLGARWLLNLAYMTVGEWPDQVPAEHRIAPELLASDAPFPRFTDIAPGLGLNLHTTSGGIAIEDFDQDGHLDLFVTTWDPRGQAVLWRAKGDGTYEDATAAANLTGITGGLNLSQADYDGDGDVDVLILRGGWQIGEHGRHPKSLLQNQGPEHPGRFLDVTFLAGLGEVHYPTQTADWADYDLDGDLDLYVGNEASGGSPFPCELFQNQGDGTFKDVARAAGVRNVRMAKGASWGDVDGDRDPDLYVSNYLDANRLYINQGNGTFVDVARERGVERPVDSFPTWFFDFDNDGALDLYVSTFFQSVGEARLGPVVSSHLKQPIAQGLNRLYKGDGKGNFRDVAQEQGLDLFTVIMGASFGDLDNDGFPDMYLGTGYPFYDGLVPNVMYWNQGGKRFADVTTAGGFGHLQKGHGIAFADLDDDGDQDVYANMGGAYPGDAFGDVLFENPGTPNHWLKLRLEGRRSNRAGIGARVRVVVKDVAGERSLYKTMGEHGSFGTSPLELHLGLGVAARVERLEIFWPVTGETQVVGPLDARQHVVVVEGEQTPRLSPARPVPFRR